MFILGAILIDPCDPVSAVDGGLESETFSASRVLQQVTQVMRLSGVSNAIQLTHDRKTIYQDSVGTRDDLTDAIRAFGRARSTVGHRFEELRLVLEHETRLLRLVIDVQVVRTHAVEDFAVSMIIAGFMKEFAASDGVLPDAQRRLLDQVFHDQAGHDAVVDAAGDEFASILTILKESTASVMQPERIGISWSPQILANEEIPPSVPDGWQLIFDHPCVTEDDVLYCYSWYPTGIAFGLDFRQSDLVQVTFEGINDSSVPKSSRAEKANPFTGLSLSLDEIPKRKRLFGWGHHNHDVWQSIADVCGCAFTPGGMFSKDSLEGTWGKYSIRAQNRTRSSEDTYDPQTFMEASFDGAFPFKGRVQPDEPLRRAIRPLWGSQDIEIGDIKFDEYFVITGPVRPMKYLLGSQKIRDLILMQRNFKLSISHSSLLLSIGTLAPDMVLRQFELMIELLMRIEMMDGDL